ncbi:MAG: hypothetical protein PSX79_09525, partial [bacterium]|nr:hypothetical protein [bacterium]
MSRFIEIVEVGPRDGLQNEAQSLSVEERLDLIRRLEACGARRMEVVSFVNPNRVPQMAGAEEIMAALIPAGGTPDLNHSRIGLVLNMRGWERCVAAQCDEANVVVCASEGFAVRNQGSSVSQQIDALAAMVERQAVEGGPPITMTLSVAFGCPFDGEVGEDQVVAIVREAAALKVAEIALGDTIGVADPWTVRKRIEAVRAAAPDTRLRMHFHDTRNTGLANAFASVEAAPSGPNRMASVWAALTTTLTTMSACCAAAAGEAAPCPPSPTNLATA